MGREKRGHSAPFAVLTICQVMKRKVREGKGRIGRMKGEEVLRERREGEGVIMFLSMPFYFPRYKKEGKVLKERREGRMKGEITMMKEGRGSYKGA